MTVRPGQQYPPALTRGHLSTANVSEPTPARSKRGGVDVTLSVDSSVIADSNVTSASDLRSLTVLTDRGPVDVEVGRAGRALSAIGYGASATLTAQFALAGNARLQADAEGYALVYPGSVPDDRSLQFAAGIGVDGHGESTLLQLVAFERWRGSETAMRGFGVRAKWLHDLPGRRHVGISLDARRFHSDWGAALTGHSASAFLSYDMPVDAESTAVFGAYARLDAMRDDTYSDRALGAYASLSHYFGSHLNGGITAGIGRTWYEAPMRFLSPDPRQDWSGYASVWLTTRKPVLAGFYPSVTYTHNRTASSIRYFSLERHRLRLGVSRDF